MKGVGAQIEVETKLTLRRGETLLVTLGIPVGILVFFGNVDLVDTGYRDPLDFLVPGVLALAVMSTAMVSLGIATAFERRYGVLKRLGTTPLGRSGLLTAKTLTVVVVEVIQAVIIVVAAVLLGWSPGGGGGEQAGGVRRPRRLQPRTRGGPHRLVAGPGRRPRRPAGRAAVPRRGVPPGDVGTLGCRRGRAMSPSAEGTPSRRVSWARGGGD